MPDSRVTLEPTFQVPLAYAPYTGTPFCTVGTPNRHACAAYAFVVVPFEKSTPDLVVAVMPTLPFRAR